MKATSEKLVVTDLSPDNMDSSRKASSALDITEPAALLDHDPTINYAHSSTYNIYHHKDRQEHFIITPLTSTYRDRYQLKDKLLDQDIFRHPDRAPPGVRENSWFVHKPYVSFHHAPRTLRRGLTKDAPVVALVHNSFFWRRWRLGFGERLSEEGVVDPRGVIPQDHEDIKSRTKGYRVRTWRLWGESGKAYHRSVNADRKAGIQQPPVKPLDGPLIDEELIFKWHSPFGLRPRHYRFDYAGLVLYWKGTNTVKEHRTCGWLMRFHHFKLCVRVPISVSIPPTNSGGGPIKRTLSLSTFPSKAFREICLAKYTSSIFNKKAGVLQIYDDVLHRLITEGVIPLCEEQKKELDTEGVVGVKRLRLYDIIVATAMCMIIGEQQKRQLIIALITLGGEGGSPGG
jgi:hypothetical protein